MSGLPVRLAPAALVVAITVTAPAAHAQSVTVTFNGPNGANDLNLFVFNDANLGQPPPPTSGPNSVFNWSATAGVSDNNGSPGGGLLTYTNPIDATAAYAGPGGTANPTTWNLQTGATIATMVQVQTLPTDRFLQIGFQNQLNNALNNNAAQANQAFVSVRLYPTSELQMQTKPVGGTTTNSDFVGAGTNLTLNNWYRLALSVQETSPTNFSATVSFDDYGPTGTSFVSNLFTGTQMATITGFEVSNGGLLGADGLGIAAWRQVDGAANLDNWQITPVPEPTSPLILAGLAGLGLAFRARRRAQ